MRSLLRHQLTLQLANAATAVLASVWLLLVGRWLGPAASSEFFAALALATMVGVALGAFRSALGRECAWVRDDADAIARLVAGAERTLVRRGVPIALASACVLVVAAPHLGLASASALAVVGCVGTRLLLDATRAGLGGRGLYGALALNQLGEAAVRIAIGALCMSVVATPSSAVSAYALAAVVAWLAARRRFVPVTGTPASAVAPWPALRALVVWNVLVAVAQYVDTISVTALAAPPEAAAFGAAAALLRGFAIVALPVQLQLTPQMSVGFARGRFDRRSLIGLVAIYLALSAIPLAICVAWPATVLRLAYGESFAALGAALLAPLAVGAVLVHLGVTIAGVMIARGRFRFLWSYAAAVIGHAAIVALAASVSVQAAAHATWIGHAVVVIVLGLEVARTRPAADA